MGSTIFHDIYGLARKISTYLPLSDGLVLDQEVDFYGQNTQLPRKFDDGEHWAIISKTGNGKTTVVKQLVKGYQQKYPWINTYFLDTKKQGDFTQKDGQIYQTYDCPPVLKGMGMKQVWQPIVDDIDEYDTYFRNILSEGKPALVIIDESKNLKKGTLAPKGYELILSQGRAAGIFTFTNYQEIANGLRQGLSQPTHLIGFSVWNAYDERMLKNYLRLPVDEPLPSQGKYSFLYINRDRMGKPLLFRNWQQFIPYFFG